MKKTTAQSTPTTKKPSTARKALLDKSLHTLHIIEHTIAPDVTKPDFSLLQKTFTAYLEERSNRAEDVESDEVNHAIELARGFFMHFAMRVMMCMDRRTKPTLAYAFPGRFAGSVRVAGGAPTGFIHAADGGLLLDPSAAFTKQLIETLQKLEHAPRHERVLVEVIDSHIHCAAQNLEAQSTGQKVSDSGHLHDVKYKRNMAETLQEFTKKHFPHTTLFAVQTSFNPENGFMYMGAAKDECIDFAQKHGGYTEEVFHELVKRKSLISTEEVAKDPKVRALFEKHAFELDWAKHYRDAAEQFWLHISSFSREILPYIKQLVQEVYPHLGIDDTELEIRSRLVLVNAYSGFLHNWKKAYQFHDHTESVVIVVNGGGYGPFETVTALEVAENEEGVLGGVALASSIIRSNRKEGRSEGDPSLPVPVIMKIRVQLQADEEHALREIDLSDLPKVNWLDMKDSEFFDYLESKWKGAATLPLRSARALNQLRHTVAKFYDRKEKLSKQFVEKQLVGIPLIIGKYRNILGVYPFTISGYKE